MELQNNLLDQGYELLPIGEDSGKPALIFKKKRVIIGSSDNCDIVIRSTFVSGIHAVIETHQGKMKLYDMNSTNGTLVGGVKIVIHELKVGDEILFADKKFTFKKAVPLDEAPPILEMLEQPIKKPSLPKASVAPTAVKDQNSSVYPLAKDPKADFSEYIFEDVETLYPIFKYDVEPSAVEVITLFNGVVMAVDYIPQKDGQVYITGRATLSHDIEYQILGKAERIPFIEVRGGDVFVKPLAGHDLMLFSDSSEQEKTKSSVISLKDDVLVRFIKGDLQIFVKRTEAPPRVDTAPLFRRDDLYRKLLILSFFVAGMFVATVSVFKPIPVVEDEQQKIERIATILYTKDLVPKKSEAITKTEKAPNVIQKAPKQEIVKAEEEKTPTPPKKEVAQQATANKSKNVMNRTQNKAAPKKAIARSSSRAIQNNNSLGTVDAYKSEDFTGTISSIVARGASKQKVETTAANAGDIGAVGIEGGTTNSTVKMANVSQKIGSLTGATSGKLDTTRGVEGIVSKNSVFTVGVPSPTVELGSMDPDLIRKIIMDHISQFRHCYQKQLDRSASPFDGVIPLNFVIGASGHVTQAGVNGDSDVPAPVAQCVVNVVRGIQFPEPRGGGKVEVSLPMNFLAKVR